MHQLWTHTEFKHARLYRLFCIIQSEDGCWHPHLTFFFRRRLSKITQAEDFTPSLFCVSFRFRVQHFVSISWDSSESLSRVFFRLQYNQIKPWPTSVFCSFQNPPENPVQDTAHIYSSCKTFALVTSLCGYHIIYQFLDFHDQLLTILNGVDYLNELNLIFSFLFIPVLWFVICFFVYKTNDPVLINFFW